MCPTHLTPPHASQHALKWPCPCHAPLTSHASPHSTLQLIATTTTTHCMTALQAALQSVLAFHTYLTLWIKN